MRWRVLVVGFFWLSCGCGSRAAQCRTARAFSAAFGNRQTSLDRYMARVEDWRLADRCDAIEAEERAESDARSASLAAVRAHPQAPELGATVREAHDVCLRNAGVPLVNSEAIYVCVQPGANPDDFLFAAHFFEQTCDAVAVSFEGMRAEDARAAIARDQGAMAPWRVTRSGYRSWSWNDGTLDLVVTGYERGTRVSFALP